MPIVGLINLKGGCGKTTSAMALATAASRRGWRAVVLDADPQASATQWAAQAEDAGDPLPFEVRVTNQSDVRRVKSDPAVWTFVDCPPSGAVVDAVEARADIVVTPLSATPADFAKSSEVAASLERDGKPYALLVTKAKPRTLALRGIQDVIEEGDLSCFDTVIPQREDISNSYGQNFGESLHGYDEVLGEIAGALGEE